MIGCIGDQTKAWTHGRPATQLSHLDRPFRVLPLYTEMLDHVSISHQSGLVLWSRSYTPAFTSLANTAGSPVNALIREAFIEGKQNEEQGFERDGYNVRWTLENGFGLVFVVCLAAMQLTIGRLSSPPPSHLHPHPLDPHQAALCRPLSIRPRIPPPAARRVLWHRVRPAGYKGKDHRGEMGQDIRAMPQELRRRGELPQDEPDIRGQPDRALLLGSLRRPSTLHPCPTTAKP